MPAFYCQSFKKQYHANWFSLVGLFAVASLAAQIILPFVFAYMTPNFWLKNSAYYEMPTVTYQNELVAELTLQDSSLTYSQPVTVVYGTNAAFNQFYAENVRMATVRTAQVDSNLDGKADYLSFSLTFPLKETETLQSVRLALVLNYELSSTVKMIMKSLAIFEAQSVPSTTGVTFFSDLKLVQRYLLSPMSSGNVFDYYNTPAINYTTPYTAAAVAAISGTVPTTFVGWPDIVSNYFARNVRTEVEVAHTTWNYASVKSSAVEPTFSVSGVLNYVQASVAYKPSVGEVLKWAWVQYLSVFVVVFFVLLVLWWFVFTRRIFDTSVTVDSSLSRVLGASGVTAGTAARISSNGYVSVSGIAPGIKPPIF